MGARSAWLDGVERTLWERASFSFIPNRDLDAPASRAELSAGGSRVVFAGFPSDYSLAFLLALCRMPVEVVGIITSPGAHPSIEGENALSRIAHHLDIPLLRAWRINDEHERREVERLAPDAVVMASFDQIVRGRMLAVPLQGWLNIHPSRLPEYRGPEPVYWAVADGVADTGITLHRAVNRFDAGPVLAQLAVAILPDDTAGTLTRRLCEAGVKLLPGAVEAQLRGDPGDALDLEAGWYRPSIGHRRLDRATSAAAAERMVRAGVPNMHAWLPVNGTPIYVLQARAGDRGIPVAGGRLELLETSPTCGCHHDRADCPHRED